MKNKNFFATTTAAAAKITIIWKLFIDFFSIFVVGRKSVKVDRMLCSWLELLAVSVVTFNSEIKVTVRKYISKYTFWSNKKNRVG